MVEKELAKRLVQGRPWHHDFEIVPGVRTYGFYNPTDLWNELRLPPDLSGVSLADVGASNGFYSFEARKRGARVVAFDFRHKDNSGFGLAQYINGMDDIEHHMVNVLDLAVEPYGRFDIVLVLGLLYHVSDPYLALANCAALCKERLLVESYCIDRLLPEPLASEPLMRFISDPARFPMQGQPNDDRSNFWGFTSFCLQRMVEDMGFAVKRQRLWGDRVLLDAERAATREDQTRCALAYGSLPHVPRGESPDDPEAWTLF